MSCLDYHIFRKIPTISVIDYEKAYNHNVTSVSGHKLDVTGTAIKLLKCTLKINLLNVNF